MPEQVNLSVILGLSALFAGMINAVAGGGTLLTFPALLSVLSPEIANGTSTLALLPGSLAGAAGYRSELAASWHFARRLILPSLIGGFFGAWLVILQPGIFAQLVPWLILAAAVLFLIQHPIMRWLKKHHPDHEPGRWSLLGLILFQFGIALYGGYFGAGIGILMLTALGFMGMSDIHRMNGVKTLLATVINIASSVVFIAYDAIHWPIAGIMAACAIIGGYLGARLARRMPTWIVRWIVIGIGFGLAFQHFR